MSVHDYYYCDNLRETTIKRLPEAKKYQCQSRNTFCTAKYEMFTCASIANCFLLTSSLVYIIFNSYNTEY